MENGYPRPTKKPGMAYINRDSDRDSTTPELLPVGPNGMLLRLLQKLILIHHDRTISDVYFVAEILEFL